MRHSSIALLCASGSSNLFFEDDFLCEENAVSVLLRCNRLEDFCSGAAVEGTGAVGVCERDVEGEFELEEVEELRSLRVKRRRRDINAMVGCVLVFSWTLCVRGLIEVEWAVQWLFTCC